MLKKMCDYFSGLKMTIISGIFLVMSLILMFCDYELFIDPAWITIILSGYPLLYLAITRLVYQKWISSCLLISIAMLASIMVNEIFAAGEVAFIMAIGAILEDMTVVRARKGLAAMIALTPLNARRIRYEDNETIEEMIKLEELKVDDALRILPGETIAVDGKIIKGETSINQAIMTGESLPADKTIGDEVYQGTLNCYGTIDIKASAIAEDTSLQQLIRLVEEANEKKAPMQRIADKWSVWLVPIALIIAILAIIFNYLAGVELLAAIKRGVTVLVVFCPCALALATPTSIMAAIGQATKHGVIIKSGEALEAMGRIDVLALDKTGTLTKGEASVSDIKVFDEKYNVNDVLEIASSIERLSEHPLAKAVVEYANEKQIKFKDVIDFKMEAGRGVKGVIDQKTYYCGNEKYLDELNIIVSVGIVEELNNFKKEAKALMILADEEEVIAVITLADILKENSVEVIKEIEDLGIETSLLSGDNRISARHFANKLGIKNIYAELLPIDKVAVVERLQKEGNKLCMVGDGVNDAPALKIASVGVAMGLKGSDIAIDAADIALRSDDLKQLAYLSRLSRSTLKTIKFNISLSMIINAIAITLSTMGVLNAVTGALVHNAGSCLVVLNAALLYDRKFD